MYMRVGMSCYDVICSLTLLEEVNDKTGKDYGSKLLDIKNLSAV